MARDPIKLPMLLVQFSILAVATVLPGLVELGYWVGDVEVLALCTLAMLAATAIAAASAFNVQIRRIAFALGLWWVVDAYILEPSVAVWFALFAIVSLAFSRHEDAMRAVGTLFGTFFSAYVALSVPHPVLFPPLKMGSASDAGGSNRLPLLVHLILDEQGSPTTLSAPRYASGRANGVFDSYLARGFTVYRWARVHSGGTERSLGRLFGPEGGPEITENWVMGGDNFRHRLKRNDYVSRLLHAGFNVNLIQTSYVELCVEREISCHSYKWANFGHSMSRFPENQARRILMALELLHFEFLDTEGRRGVMVYRPFGELLVRHFDLPRKRQFWTSPASTLTILDQIESRIPFMRQGDAYIAHLLLPHFPYNLSDRCELKERDHWMVPAWVADDGHSDIPRETIESAYWQQVECLHSRLIAIVDKIDSRFGRGSTVFVLHGDHGSRLLTKAHYPTSAVINATEPNTSLDTVLLTRGDGSSPSSVDGRVFLESAFREALERILASHAGVEQ
jgi:hypothetical protein